MDAILTGFPDKKVDVTNASSEFKQRVNFQQLFT